MSLPRPILRPVAAALLGAFLLLASPLGATEHGLLLIDRSPASSVRPGAVVAFTLTVQNTSDVEDLFAEVSASFPDGVVMLRAGSVSAASGTVVQGNSSSDTGVRVLLDTVPPGASTEVRFDATVAGLIPSGVDAGLVELRFDQFISVSPPVVSTDTFDVRLPILAAPDLRLTKSDGGQVFAPRGTVTYSIEARNAGDQDATGIVLTETIPDFTTFDPEDSEPGWQCLPNGSARSVCTFDLPLLSAFTNRLVDFALTLDPAPVPPGFEVVTNVVTLRDDGANTPSPIERTAQEDTPVLAGPNLRVTKRDGGASVGPGGVTAYTITLDNWGTQPALGVQLLETVPEHASFEPGASSSGWSCVPDGSAGATCTMELGTLPSLSSLVTRTFAVRAAGALPAAVSALDNTVTARDDGTSGPDLDPTDNTARDTTPLVGFAPDLALLKDDGGAEAGPDEVVVYTLSYQNRGNRGATGVEVVETVPQWSAFEASGSSPGWTCAGGGSAGASCTWFPGTLEPGGSGTVTFAVRTVSTVPAGVDRLLNSARIGDDGANGQDGDPTNNTATDETPLTGFAPDLGVTKDDAGATAHAGQSLVYALQYANLGSRGAQGVLLEETVPSHTSFAPGASTPSWTCSPASGAGGASCVLALGALAPGASGSATFAVTVDETFTAGVDQLVNTVVIRDDATGGPDADPDNNRAVETTPLEAAPDLRIGKDDHGVTAHPGEILVYTLTYSNEGTQTATGVFLRETVPASGTFAASASNADWMCSPDPDSGSTCLLLLGNVSPGESGTATFAVHLDDTVPAGVVEVVNTASIGDDGANGPDLDPGDNEDRATTPLDAAPDLRIEKDDHGATARTGETLVYTLTYGNDGTQTATGVYLRETVPASGTFAAGASSPEWVCSPDTGSGSTCILLVGNVSPGESGTATFAVLFDDVVPAGVAEVVNTASVGDDGANGPDLDPGDNEDRATTPLDAAPDLSITKTDDDVTALPGEVVVYSLAYANQGTQGATGVVLEETVPAHTTFAPGASDTGWSCSPQAGGAGAACALAVGDVAVSATGTATFAVRIDEGLPFGVEEITNVVTLRDDATNGPDPNPENDRATETTPIDATPDLQIEKSDGGATARPGDALAYTLSYRNVGTQGAARVLLEERVPAQTVFAPEASTPGWTCSPASGSAGATCTLEAGSLAAGSSGEATFAVRVDSVLGASVDELVNTVTIRDDGSDDPDPTPDDNRATETTPLDARPDLVVTKDDSGVTVRPGETLVYGLTYENVGSQSATGVFLRETVPAYTSLASGASAQGWLCSGAEPGSTCTLALGNLAPGDSGSATFAVLVDSALPSGVVRLDNSVTVGDDGANGEDSNPGDNEASEATPVESAPDLSVTKTDDDITARPGDLVLYRVAYANHGDQAATGVVLEETLPASTGFEPGGSSSGWVCPSPAALAGKLKAERIQEKAGGSVLCTLPIGDLPAGGSGSVTFAVRVEAPLPAGVEALANTVRIFDDGANGPDPSPGDNEASATTPVEAAPDLAVGVSDGDVTARPGDVVVYAIDFTNRGDQGATGVVLDATVPLHAAIRLAASTPGWVCSAAGAAALDRRLKAERIQSDAEAESAAEGLEAEGLRERRGPQRVSGRAVGGTTCTLAVGALAAGAGGSAAFAVAVDDPLPATAGPLETVVRVADDGTNGPDPSPADNVATETTPLELPEDPGPDPDPEPGAVLDLYLVDFLVEDRDDSGSFSAGDVISYSVDLRNTGTVEAREVVFTLPVPAHTAFVDGSVSGDRPVEPSVADGILTVRLQDLSAGDVAALAWDVVIDLELPPEVDEIVAQGAVTAAGVDPHPSDDPDTVEPDDPTVTPLEAGGGPGEVQPIPTVSELGLLLLGLLLALGAWRVLR